MSRSPVLGAELRLVEMALRRPHVAGHGTEADRRVALVRLMDDAGISGWGECSALRRRGYSDEDIAGAWHELRSVLVPAVLAGRDLPAGGPMARAAVTSAVAVLGACREGRSLAAHLASLSQASPPRTEVASTAVVAVEDDLGVLLTEVQGALDAGHRSVKVKIHPGWDTEPLHLIRARWPGLALSADANGTYADEPERLAALAGFGLDHVEQPLAAGDLAGHAALTADGAVRVALDESVTSVEAVREIAHLDAAMAVNVKLARLGGPVEALAVLGAAREAGLDAWCGGMLETGVGRAVALAVAAQSGFTLPSDLGPSARYVVDDLVEPPPALSAAGTLAVPAGAGLGAAIRQDRLDEVTLDRWVSGELAP